MAAQGKAVGNFNVLVVDSESTNSWSRCLCSFVFLLLLSVRRCLLCVCLFLLFAVVFSLLLLFAQLFVLALLPVVMLCTSCLVVFCHCCVL